MTVDWTRDPDDRPAGSTEIYSIKTCPIETFHAELLATLHAMCFDDSWSASSFQAALETPGTFGVLVLNSRTDEPLSFGLFRMAAGEADVLTIATRPDARAQGLARRVMTHTIDALRSGGAQKMVLEVGEDNKAALRLYASLGFTKVGHRPGYYARRDGTRGDAYIFSLTF